MVDQLSKETLVPEALLCRIAGLPVSSLRRWQTRARRGEEVVKPPGPKKAGPLNFDALTKDIESLRHRQKRSQGTGNLQHKYKASLSRRALGRLISQERKKVNSQRQRKSKRIQWNRPMTCWAIDATEYSKDKKGQRLYIHALTDLSSRMRFEPLVALESSGSLIASYLEKMFLLHGAPRFLKRDNGSAFNHLSVDRVLSSFGVIPLNSPAYYPPYNGSVENSIRELKDSLRPLLPVPEVWQPQAISPFIAQVAFSLNCKPRRCLNGLSAFQCHPLHPVPPQSLKQRTKSFDWIRNRFSAILASSPFPVTLSLSAKAWRRAVEDCLHSQGLVTIKINNHVLPHSLPLQVS